MSPRTEPAEFTDGRALSVVSTMHFPALEMHRLFHSLPQLHIQVVKYKVLSVHFPGEKIVSLNSRCSAICIKCLWRFINTTDHGGVEEGGRQRACSPRRRDSHKHAGFLVKEKKRKSQSSEKSDGGFSINFSPTGTSEHALAHPRRISRPVLKWASRRQVQAVPHLLSWYISPSQSN